MPKRNLLNLALLLIVISLITLVVFEPGKELPIVPPTLTNLAASDIRHIQIKRAGDNYTIELMKNDNDWVMLQPYRQSANSFRIKSILKLLSAVSFSQNNLADLNPAEFGLAPPQATITFNKTTTIEFGHNKSLKNHRYVKIDSVLHMIADTFYYQLAANAESFINHKILPEKSKIMQLTLPSIKLEMNEGKWQATPRPIPFSADSINQLIDEWQLSQAYDIKIKQIILNAKPDIQIRFKNNDVLRFKMEYSKANFSLTNIDSGVSYILSAGRKDKLLKLSPVEPDDSQ